MADKRIMQLPIIAPADLDAQVFIPVVDDSEIDPLLKNKRAVATDLKGTVTGTAETGITIRTKLEGLTGTDRLDASAIKNLPTGTGTFNGVEEEVFTSTPYTTLAPTSLMNIINVFWNGWPQERPNAGNTIGDYSHTVNPDGTITINANPQVTGGRGKIIYVATGAATVLPTPPAPASQSVDDVNDNWIVAIVPGYTEIRHYEYEQTNTPQPPPPSEVFLDNFNGSGDITAHAADIGGTWTGPTGIFLLNGSGQAVAQSGNWVYNTPTGAHSQLVVQIRNHGLGQGANVLFRTRNNNADFLLVGLTRAAVEGNPGEIIIYQSIGGTSTQIASVAHTGHSGVYTLTMTFNAGTFSATISGVGTTATASATTTFTAAATDRIGINFAAGIQADQITAE